MQKLIAVAAQYPEEVSRTLRDQLLDEREAALDRREKDLDRREERLGRRPSRREMERMADQIEPPDPGWTPLPPEQSAVDLDMFRGVGRNEACPCGSGRKFKNCHWDQVRHQG
ncbi:MAG TPA: SEC-C metal-binding domain-containing protein [Acidimicrobiia bacterium]|nr:SEC-C metal-binding domain-containing protein [Acidimicrobiia bacterium]